ncbi:lysophosphatidic acid receptor 1 isoform X2 [Passer domesticus]|uniref:lysophosphatidic acid receptor 1 isoform X2 n=1 Tax=Passer domesticus TaxID=48849 RepID=UPI0030FE2506
MDIPTDLVPSSMMSQPEVIESTAMSEPQCYYNETIAFFYNRSGKYLATEWNTVSKLVMGLGITVCIFIMLANLLVMVAIYVNRRFHFPIYYLMANLAAADFFAGLAYFYLMFNTGPNTRRLTVSTWLLRQGLIDTSLTASVANLLAIAIERHITVFRMQLHTRMSNRRVVVVIVVIWTMAIVMGAIPSVGWNCICDITHCSNMAPLYSDSYLVFWAIFNLVTFVVMVVLYAHIFGYVRQRTMRMSRHSSGPRRNRDTMMSLLKTVVIVLGSVEGPPGGVQVGRHAADRISRRKARSLSVSIPCLHRVPVSTRDSKHKVLQRTSSQRFPHLPLGRLAEGKPALHHLWSGFAK